MFTLTWSSRPPGQKCSSVWIRSVCRPPPGESGAPPAGSPWPAGLPSGRTLGTVAPSPSGQTETGSSGVPPKFSSSAPYLEL